MKIAIAGGGKLGLKIAEALFNGNHSVTIIDKDEAVIEKVSNSMDILTINANAKQISTLEEMEIHEYDTLLAATDSDEQNIVIASFAKKLGCKRVIARIRDMEHMNQLDFIKDNMAIDHIVNPDLSITVEIYKYLVEKYTLSNGIFSSGKISLLEFKVNKMPEIIGVSMTRISDFFPNMLVVAISRNGKVIVPHGDTNINKNDVVYIVGEKEPIEKLSHSVHEKGKYTKLQKVMILGGGKTGLYLAKKLSDFGINVKLIERDKGRCHYLASKLDGVMVLHGDATDTELLLEENLTGMDAVVTATGFDEDNLLLALIAKQNNVEDVIAKVSRTSYISLIERMGVDMVLNPLNITAATILRYVQGSKNLISSQLIQGQAEIIEIIANKQMSFIGVPIKNLNLPDGLIIAGIHRGTKVIVPNGETKIDVGDKVMILCLLSDIPDLEKLLTPKKIGFFKGR